MPVRNLSSATASAASSSLPSWPAIGPFQMWKVPSFRPFLTSSIFALASAGTSSARSEEHTSELQSQSNLVCRLLLEKKKSTTNELLYATDIRDSDYIP